ncbi:hypothetical protein EON65_42260 [archaeon]|nr:MAG: hypothetical protein EON65_42260 [archaeon]
MNPLYIERSSSDSDDSMKTNHVESANTPITPSHGNILDLLTLHYGDDVNDSNEMVEGAGNYDTELPVYGPDRPHTPLKTIALIPLDLTNSPNENDMQQEEARPVVTLDSSKKKVEWVEKILIPKNLGENTETRVRSKEEYYWKQALWSTLVIITQSAKTVDVYVGYDRPDLLPRGWGLSTSFKFSLLDSEGNVVKQSEPILHYFSVPFKTIKNAERADRGLKKMFDHNIFMSHIYPLEDSAEYGVVDIGVRD